MSTTHSTHAPGAGHHGDAGHKTHAHESAESKGKAEIPTLDIGKLLERFRLPDIDLSALAEAQRKNIEALQQANEKAYAGAVALVQRQVEIFRETMAAWQEATKEFSFENPVEGAAKRMEFARKAMEQAFGHMRELAEMAAKSQGEAYDVIRKRAEAGMREFRDYLRKRA